MDNIYVLDSNGELYHWGIKGMKWGVRRYQNADGSLTPAGQKRYDDDLAAVKAKTEKIREKQRIKQEAADRKNAMKAAKQELADARKGKKPEDAAKKAEEAAKKAEEAAKKAAEDDNAKRERLLKSPNAKEVLENRHLFTNTEIQGIRLRLNEERMIADLAPPEIDKGQQFVDKFTKTTNQVSSVIESGSKAWNGVAKLYNSFFAEKTGVELPMISDKVKSATDKIKAKAERIKADADLQDAKNKLAEALKKDPNREKTADEQFDEETRQINRKVARRKAENSMAEEEARRVKAENSMAEEAGKRAEREAKAKVSADKAAADKAAYEEYQQGYKNSIDIDQGSSDSTTTYRSGRNKSERYRSSGGERTTVNPGALAVRNSAASSRGESYVKSISSPNAISTNVASKIQSMTSSGNKSYAEIAKQLGVSTSTVQNYSRGRDYVDGMYGNWDDYVLVGDD